MLSILHVSDVHFGTVDSRGEQKRITDALTEAARASAIAPDLVVFSGDLAHRGSEAEFSEGLRWLDRLVAPPWKPYIAIVPGNHDVNRESAEKTVLRQACESEQVFAGFRDNLSARAPHLNGFRAWHKTAKGHFGERLLSDWDGNLYGFRSAISVGEVDLRLVGLNTSILSCGDDDYRKLAVDISTLNSLLYPSPNHNSLVVAVGHHPLEWLIEWNSTEIRKLLYQESGAHLYLHGHQHEQHASSRGDSMGRSLATLECGAAYEGSRWPQYFCFYTLDFNRREISSSAYLFSTNTGQWIADAEARPFVAPIPLIQYRSSSPILAAPPLDRHSSDSDVSSPGPTEISQAPFGERESVELHAWRAIAEAEAVAKGVEEVLNASSLLKETCYQRSGRIKRRDRIIEKVLKRRADGNGTYSVSSLTDICGFRLVTWYQSGIPAVVGELIRTIKSGSARTVMFKANQTIEIAINTSRSEEDPLSIARDVAQVVQDSGVQYSLAIQSRPTGYSSVHITVSCALVDKTNEGHSINVEFQVRSALEEFWGQLDHRLRYESSRGALGGSPSSLHLNVLKSHFDTCITYVDLIRELSERRLESAPPEVRSARTVETPDKEMDRLRGLPERVAAGMREAYGLWKDADASRQFGGSPGLFRRAADAFQLFVSGCPDEVEDGALSKRLSYTARMERAYLLMYTGDSVELAEAATIYGGIVKESPSDAVALFRLGQVQRRQRDIEGSILTLSKAIELIRRERDLDIEKDLRWVFDSARLGLALANWRLFQLSEQPLERRKEAIGEAIKLARSVLEEPAESTGDWRPINDLLYYSWEERNAFPEAVPYSLSEVDFAKLCRQLEDANPPAKSYEHYDTKVRAHRRLGNIAAAREAASTVCDLLERASELRNGGAANTAERLSFQWAGQVVGLLDADERDSFLYALDVLTRNQVA